MQISKTDYMAYLKHPALLWLRKNNPDALPPPSADLQAIFDAGHDFEQYAEARFMGGVALGFADGKSYATLPERTQQVLVDGAKTIFQGRFVHENLTFICDIIDVVGDNELDVYEIKSSTGAKSEHIDDLAFQTIVLQGLGYVIRNLSVIHVNNTYVRQGEIEARHITAVTDVSDGVRARLSDTNEQITKALAVANSSIMPSASPALASKNGFSDWMEVYKTLHPYGPDSIYNLAGLNPKLVADFNSKGYAKLSEIPVDSSLSEKQRMQLRAVKRGEPIIDKQKIAEFLHDWQYPLYFLDYETLGGVVPCFDGMKPYQQLPFQYSLHTLRTPDSPLEHHDYLHSSSDRPTRPLLEQLIKDIGESGTIAVWNASFEKSCNTFMGQLEPEYMNALTAINKRIVDLIVPFRQQWYVDAGFKGSASIKKVLPVLVPELSYAPLGIQEGNAAQRQWMQTILHGKNLQDKQKVLADLRAYCKLDTLAMVKIFEFLQTTVYKN